MRDPRLGDDVDDFCVRCKRVMNHAIVSVMNNEPAKVRCRTCYNDHDFRHEQAPPPKVDSRKAALFSEVLKKVAPGESAVTPTVEDLDPELEIALDEAAAEEESIDPEPEPEVAVEASKEKAKPKGKVRKG